MVEGRALMRQTRISILLSNFASYACLRHSTQLPIYLISPCCCSLQVIASIFKDTRVMDFESAQQHCTPDCMLQATFRHSALSTASLVW